MGKPLGPNVIKQNEHLNDANARKVTQGVMIPGKVIAPGTDNISTAGVLVGKGNIIRLQTSADSFVAFGDDTIAAVTVTTTPAIKLVGAGVHLIVATDDFIRADLVQVRLEVISK